MRGCRCYYIPAQPFGPKDEIHLPQFTRCAIRHTRRSGNMCRFKREIHVAHVIHMVVLVNIGKADRKHWASLASVHSGNAYVAVFHGVARHFRL